MPQAKINLIQEDLSQEILEHYLNKDVIAIDCEMMGLNLHRDRLCLIQIGDRDQKITLVQIAQEQKEAPRLKKLLESANPLKLFHYARTDLTWLHFWLDIKVENVFCTKVASKIARTFSDKHGLKDICKELTGKELKKDQQSSYWGAEEINANQIKYAANDVLYLVDIYEKLLVMLKREGRLDLVEKCNDFIRVLSKLDSLGYENILDH